MLKIDTRILVNSKKQPLWHTIQNFKSYPQWNPMIVSMKGKPEAGEKLRMNAKGIFGFPLFINATFLKKSNDDFIQWGGGIKGILYGVHTFELHDTTDNETTELHHYEEFTGILTLFMKGFFHKKITTAYQKHNLSLKSYMENNPHNPSYS